MEEQQIKILLYENQTKLRAEFTLPDTDESYNTLLRLKTEWEQKEPNNMALIQRTENIDSELSKKK